MSAKKLYVSAIIIAILVSGYEVGVAIYAKQTTGILKVSSSISSATLTVAQSGRQSANIGMGSARIHLKPGKYDVIASSGSKQTIKSVEIQKRSTTSAALSFTPQVSQNNVSGKGGSSNLLTQLLPYTGPASEYKITYTYSFVNNIAQATIIIASATLQGRQDALSWIKSVGFDPSSLSISYTSLTTQ